MEENKLILVVYIRVDADSTAEETNNYLDELKNHFEDDDDNIKYYIIPIFDKDSYIECINPQLITVDEYKYVEETLNNYQKSLNIFISKYQKKG